MLVAVIEAFDVSGVAAFAPSFNLDFRKCVFFDDRSGVLGDAVVAGKLAIASVAGLEGFDVCGVAAFAPSFNLDFRKRVFFSMIGVASLGVPRLRAKLRSPLLQV